MSTYEDRLKALREQLRRDRLDGFVVPLTDEGLPGDIGHIVASDSKDPFGGFFRRETKLPGDPCDPLRGKLGAQLHLTAGKERWIDESGDDGGIGDGRLGAPAVTRRPGIGAGTLGSDPQGTTRVDPRQAAAAASPPR